MLDAIQLGLDIAGVIPVAGEVCDLTNAIISAGRGNTGDAMLSLAATFPFGGQAATAGKLSNKAAKALAKNADKLDEVVDGTKAVMKKLDDVKPPCSNGLCFAAGTPVLAESGEKPIETIAVGERVWACDVISGEWQLREVLRTFESDFEGDLISVIVGNDTIQSTIHHPYWVVSGQDLNDRPMLDHLEVVPPNAATPGRWVDSGDLQIGDMLLLRDGRSEPITNVRVTSVKQKVYNFEVNVLHTYTVGQIHVLVHNTDCGGLLHAQEQFRGISNNVLNKTIDAEQHVLLRKLFAGNAASGLTVESLEAAKELSRRAILNTNTTSAQVLVHQDRILQIAEALGKL